MWGLGKRSTRRGVASRSSLGEDESVRIGRADRWRRRCRFCAVGSLSPLCGQSSSSSGEGSFSAATESSSQLSEPKMPSMEASLSPSNELLGSQGATASLLEGGGLLGPSTGRCGRQRLRASIVSSKETRRGLCGDSGSAGSNEIFDKFKIGSYFWAFLL